MFLHLLDGVKDVGSEPFIANRAIVALDICVLLGLSRLDIAEGDLPF